ncbi:MAG: endonuclease/exonuclease/phosphatase family protein [Bacteroidales bacterium]|nr:endonuclease/exonuclease/phosphatase family protein [Bacteroidales bacterium]
MRAIRVFLLILACAAILLLMLLASRSYSFCKRGKDDGIHLRLVSWNADNFLVSQDTMLRAASFIGGIHPDIICLQERPHTSLVAWDSIRTAFGELEYAAVNSREDEVLNLAILSRWPILEMVEYYVPDSYNKSLCVDIAMPEDTVRLFNVHLQTNGLCLGSKPSAGLFRNLRANAAKRKAQVEEIASAVAASPYPVIVCGDLNVPPASYSYRKISAFLDDAFLKAGKGWGGSYQGLGGLLRIDYILCSPAFAVSSYSLVPNAWSDHKIQILN